MEDNKKEKPSKKISYIFTKETLGITLMLFGALTLLILFTRSVIFGDIGSAICTFMYGTFGYGSWFVMALVISFGVRLTFGKSVKVPLKKAVWIVATALCVFFLFQAVTTGGYELLSYGKYISDCYYNAAGGWAAYTFGGVISALIVYPVIKLSFIAAYIIFSVLTLAFGYLTFISFKGGRISFKKRHNEVSEAGTAEVLPENSNTGINNVQPEVQVIQEALPVPEQVQYETQRRDEQTDKYSQKNLGRKILFENGEFAAESYRRNMIFNENSYFSHSAAITSESDYLSSFSSGGAKSTSVNNTDTEKRYSETYREEILNQPAKSAPSNYIYGGAPVTDLNGGNQSDGGIYTAAEHVYDNIDFEQPAEDIIDTESVYEQPSVDSEDSLEDNQTILQQDAAPKISEEPFVRFSGDRNVGFGEVQNQRESENEKNYTELVREEDEITKKSDGSPDIYKLFGSSSVRGDRTVEPRYPANKSNAELFDDDSDDVFGRGIISGGRETVSRENKEPFITERKTERKEIPSIKPVEQNVAAEQDAQPQEKPKHIWKKYVRPSLDLLDDYPENSNVNTGEIEDSKRIIVETLERFKIGCEVSNVTIGPAITRYDVIIHDKTNIKKSLNYREAVAMELRKENVNAYLNYSKGALSIEVPNNRRTVVGLKSMLASPKFLNSKSNSLTFGLGKNVEGEVVCPDITKMPHLLVAGTTGSGKSICLSSLLISLLYKYGPEDLRMILVDPKQVEFISYDKLPHLMINEIIYECDKAIKALNWAIKEMERRYTLFKDMTEGGRATKNLDEYNAHLPEGEEKLPKILIVLDEFGDLMLQAKKDIESRIIKLVQKARACGIHLILATQRPSVDCITGLIKSNLPTRIGFKVNSFDDARTIFDIGGAEKLLGRGDMYFRSAENPDLARIQGCFVDTHEVQKVTDFIKEHNETYFDQTVSDFINKVEQEETTVGSIGSAGDGGEESETKIDDTFIKALKYCVTSNQASVSMIQRRFPIGYIKACKIIDWMENMNYITQSEGSKPRKVLLSKDEFENIYGDDIDD